PRTNEWRIDETLPVLPRLPISLYLLIYRERRRAAPRIFRPNKDLSSMDMSGEYRIAAMRDKVWQALNDPAILKQCIPGCESLEKLSGTEMNGKVTAKVGPVTARFGACSSGHAAAGARHRSQHRR